jgi:hypothetical protein
MTAIATLSKIGASNGFGGHMRLKHLRQQDFITLFGNPAVRPPSAHAQQPDQIGR